MLKSSLYRIMDMMFRIVFKISSSGRNLQYKINEIPTVIIEVEAEPIRLSATLVQITLNLNLRSLARNSRLHHRRAPNLSVDISNSRHPDVDVNKVTSPIDELWRSVTRENVRKRCDEFSRGSDRESAKKVGQSCEGAGEVRARGVVVAAG